MKRLGKIVAEFRKGLLNGKPSGLMCFEMSSALVSYLIFCGYECELTRGFVYKFEHYWVTLNGGTIIDATADQFNRPDGGSMPDVYIGLLPDWYHTTLNAVLRVD